MMSLSNQWTLRNTINTCIKNMTGDYAVVIAGNDSIYDQDTIMIVYSLDQKIMLEAPINVISLDAQYALWSFIIRYVLTFNKIMINGINYMQPQSATRTFTRYDIALIHNGEIMFKTKVRKNAKYNTYNIGDQDDLPFSSVDASTPHSVVSSTVNLYAALVADVRARVAPNVAPYLI